GTLSGAGTGIESPADCSGNLCFGPVDCTVSGNPGFYTAQVDADGVLHDSDVDQSIALIQKSVTVEIVECITVAQCPASPGVCANEACVENVCVVQFTPSTTECRASAGVCDLPESCTGSSADCPADAFKPSTTECRA